VPVASRLGCGAGFGAGAGAGRGALEDHLSEAFEILRTQPDVAEVLVDRVRFLRLAEVEGRYADVLTTLSGRVA
jgi:hypothetical protein